MFVEPLSTVFPGPEDPHVCRTPIDCIPGSSGAECSVCGRFSRATVAVARLVLTSPPPPGQARSLPTCQRLFFGRAESCGQRLNPHLALLHFQKGQILIRVPERA
jgi:LSD1 subclass zinc finger protein